MNRFWFGAGLLIVLLILGLGSSALMEKTHFSQAEDLRRAAELSLEGNWTGAKNFAHAAQREWDKHKSVIAGLCDHEPMDQAEGLFAQLEVFAGMKDTNAFSSTCLYLASQLEALGKSHSFNFQNLF